jgi:lambda family phage tail tape measure protein
MASPIDDYKFRISLEGEGNLKKIADGAENAKSKIEGLGTAILGVSFGAFIMGALEAADKISDLSDATGIAIVNIAAFEEAMDSAGGKAKNLERAINGFAAAIETANDGSDKAREAFAKVGVSLQDLKNLSEQDLLDQTIKGLAKMKEEGKSASEIAAVASTLLTKAFRGVEVQAFFEKYKEGKITLAEVAEGIRKGAEENDKLEKKYRDLQRGALQALVPIIDLLGGHNTSVEQGKRLVELLGGALLAAFAAKTIVGIFEFIKLMRELNILTKVQVGYQIALTSLQGPKGWAILAASAAATAAAIYGLNKALETNAKDMEFDAGAGVGWDNQPANAGSANRAQGVSPKERAVMESNKRIAQSQIESTKFAALKSEDERAAAALKGANELISIEQRAQSEINKIKINSDAEVKKALKAIDATENISPEQKVKEKAAKEKEITAKAAEEIAKIDIKATQDAIRFRTEQNKKAFEVLQSQRDDDAAAWQKYYDEVKTAQLAAFNQVETLVAQNKEIEARLELEKNILGMSALQEAETRKLFDIEQKRTAEIKKLNENKNLPEEERIIAIRNVNREIDKQRQAVIDKTKFDKENQENFSLGWELAFVRYRDNAKNANKQAADYFATFTKGFEDAIVKFVRTGKLSFQDLANSIIEQFVRISVQQALTAAMTPGGGSVSVGSLITSGFNALGGLLGFKAEGGAVGANQPYVVGEKGPELFIPQSAGNIVPNSAMGGSGVGTTVVNYNISAVDASSFRSLVARDPSFIYAVTEQGRRSQPSRRLTA